MTRADLTEELCQELGTSLAEFDTIVVTMLDSMVRSLRSGNKAEIRGFGISFVTVARWACRQSTASVAA